MLKAKIINYFTNNFLKKKFVSLGNVMTVFTDISF